MGDDALTQVLRQTILALVRRETWISPAASWASSRLSI
jgi:hypothetical protein